MTAQKLTNAVEQLEASDADTLIPVVSFPIHPREPWWWNRDGWYSNIRNIWTADPRTCSLIIMMWVSLCIPHGTFAVNQKLMVGNILPLVVSELEVQDIDNLTDWKIAEMKYRLMTEEK